MLDINLPKRDSLLWLTEAGDCSAVLSNVLGLWEEIVLYYITSSIITRLDPHCLDQYPYDTNYREQLFSY